MKVEPADFIAFRPPPLSNLSLLSFDPLLLSLWEYSILFFHFSFPCPVRLDVVLLAPSNSLERRKRGKEKEERGKKSGNEKKQRIKVYKYTAEERFAKQTVPTLEERGHEMPSFQREDNDRCENAHYILLINLTMRARRSRLTRAASVERAYVQGRGC